MTKISSLLCSFFYHTRKIVLAQLESPWVQRSTLNLRQWSKRQCRFGFNWFNNNYHENPNLWRPCQNTIIYRFQNIVPKTTGVSIKKQPIKQCLKLLKCPTSTHHIKLRVHRVGHLGSRLLLVAIILTARYFKILEQSLLYFPERHRNAPKISKTLRFSVLHLSHNWHERWSIRSHIHRTLEFCPLQVPHSTGSGSTAALSAKQGQQPQTGQPAIDGIMAPFMGGPAQGPPFPMAAGPPARIDL